MTKRKRLVSGDVETNRHNETIPMEDFLSRSMDDKLNFIFDELRQVKDESGWHDERYVDFSRNVFVSWVKSWAK